MPTIDNTGTICSFMWSGLEIDAKGEFRPCCVFEGILTDSTGQNFNIRKNSLDEVLNCRDLKELRSQMLSGKRPTACANCWSQQDAGIVNTHRHSSNQMNTLDSSRLSTDAESLQSVGIALGNTCNLKCRICGPWASSSWASDEIKRIGKTNSSWEHQLLKQGAWPRKSPEFWDNIAHHFKQVKNINIYGGEPFMAPENQKLLETLAAFDHHKNICISYNTNGTVFPENYIDIFKKFKKIILKFSIDDINDRFDYQRKNANWHQVVDNVNRFREISNVTCSINCTVSVFNALYLDEIFKYFNNVWPDMHCEISVLRLIECHSILYSPIDFKNAVKARLESANFSSRDTSKFKNLTDLMFAHQSNNQHWKDLKENIRAIDSFRNENIRNSHPELAELLDNL
jgi:MoaA/NifB/PqqE/SkfB family radical SAM enzyme